ncbi:hypothetical protein BX616_003184 [Lobosporangium transversale]|nr:hypothetical protein BX616_003184 [Lobosporangium transversale]
MHDNPTLKARVLNICPAFEKLDSVYSASLSVNPPRPIQSTNFANPGISDSDGNDGNETETSIIDIEDDENESTTDVVKTLNTGKIVKRSRKASEHINAEIMLQLLQETRKKQENDVKWTSDRRHLVTNRENAVCHREHVMFSRESELQELYRDKMTKIEITEESLRRRLDERDAQIELLKQKRDEEVDQLKQAKDEELKQLRQEKDAELNRLKQENDAEMKRLRQEKDEELKRLRQEKDEELEKLKQEIKSVKEDHEREKQKLRDERDEERKDRVVLEKQLIPVMCEKAALQKELETLKTVRLQK